MGLFDFFRKKTSANGSKRSEEEEDPTTRICFVLSAAATAGDLSPADDVVAKVFGPGYTAEISEGNIVIVSHGEETVGFLAHMPAPIPNGEAENDADGNFLWPDGKEKAAAHQSHVIVTNILSTDATPVQSAITVSRLALVALEVFDGIGVYWGDASVCNSGEIFKDFCENISEEHLPIPMWLRFQPLQVSDTEIGIYTLGMQQFGLMDIEVDRCRMDLQELFEFVSNLAHYIIQSGPVIADGNTVGGSEEEKILVRHRPSVVDESRHVYKIVFEGQ